jgi:hypothetical protein
LDFDVGKVRSPRPSQLQIKIVELTSSAYKSVVDETFDLEVRATTYRSSAASAQTR